MNGELVTYIYVQLDKTHIRNDRSPYGLDIDNSENIREIVTKEMYESVKYEVKQ